MTIFIISQNQNMRNMYINIYIYNIHIYMYINKYTVINLTLDK